MKGNIAQCSFTSKYHNYKLGKIEEFRCEQLPLGNKELCIFHDEAYLKDVNEPEYKEAVIKRRLNRKMENSIIDNISLVCIGYHLPGIKIEGEFKQPVYFRDCKFSGDAYFHYAEFSGDADFSVAAFSNRADFHYAEFSGEANFSVAAFSGEANFSVAAFSGEANFSVAAFSGEANFSVAAFSGEANFSSVRLLERSLFIATTFSNKGITFFQSVIFEKPNDIQFDVKDMSRVSFLDSDITGVRFSNKAKWGGKDKYQIIEEECFEKLCRNATSKSRNATSKSRKVVNLQDVLLLYRNLRENYVLRHRYDEADKFFIREIELRRKYKLIHLRDELAFPFKQKNWFERNFLSLLGWHHILSNYGNSIWRPIVTGMVIIFLCTIFFVAQRDPYQEPFIHGSTTSNNTLNMNTIFIGFDQFGNSSHLQKALVRTIGDFIPILSMPNDIKVGLFDYVIKIIGVAITFGLILTALRRRLERIGYN